ncbi:MAG TPA: hypothetical protein VJ397_04080 [Thermoplasmata archaeon]|nr:hypothetical protein [Thermoplasmata archaeon]
MVKGKGKTEKTMEAESVTLLKHMLEMELAKVREENAFDVVLFMGVDGRIFSSSIPAELSPDQYRLLNLVKGNLVHICGQLGSKNMKFSVQQYEVGSVFISGVGEKAFLLMFTSRPVEVTQMEAPVRSVLQASAVLRHLFEIRPLTEEYLARQPPEVAAELKRLTRRLFVEKYEETGEFRRNMEVLKFLREGLVGLVGVGPAQEILQLVFSEAGTAAKFMKEEQWMAAFDRLVARLREQAGDVAAEKAKKEWGPEVRRLLKSFV